MDHMNFFKELGTLVAHLWRQKNLDERAFPEVAMQALEQMPPSQNVSFRDAVIFGMTDPLPAQSDLDAEFGQPPLTVYADEAFRIEVLFWLKALPSIHQHGFSGAFHVMQGTTLHTTWEFRQRERIRTGLLLGDLKMEEAEFLRQGESRLIPAGNRFIHTTYHLQQPTLSVVVRTIRERDFLPQYAYFPPSVAFDEEELRPSVVRRGQLLAVLLKLGRTADCFDVLQHLLATCDDSAAFHYLLWANRAIQDGNMLHELLLSAKIKHAHLAEELEPVLKYARRQSRLESIKDSIYDPDLQFFLGVLLNVPDYEMAMSILREQYPFRDPVATAVQLTDRLSKLGGLGFQLNDTWRLMLSCTLRGITQEEIKQLFERRYGAEAVSKTGLQIEELGRALREFWMFEPYFQPIGALETITEAQPQFASAETHA